MGIFLHANIIGDFHKLKQVIRNIISNALKFTREGGSVTVTLTLENYSFFDLSSSTTTMMMPIKDEKNRSENTSITIGSPYNSVNDGENMNSFVDKYYIKLSVEDSGPGISEVYSIVYSIKCPMIRSLSSILIITYVSPPPL
jgi:signal transduction histidine kinase